MWWEADDHKPSDEDIRLVAVSGSVNLVRDIAWYDIDGMCWENLKGEKIEPILWNDIELPVIPDDYYM